MFDESELLQKKPEPRDYTGATAATKKSPKLYRIEQHESLTVSNILALHRRAGWLDGIYYLTVYLMMA